MKEGSHGVSRPRCLSLLCPSPSRPLPHDTPPLSDLQLAHPLISDTHVFWTWGEEVEEGEWEWNSRFGSVGELQSKKIDESSRRQWEVLLRVETGSIYIPTLCHPGQFWLCVLPYHAGVPSVWNVLVAWNIHTVLYEPTHTSLETPKLISPAPVCHFVSTSVFMCVFAYLTPGRLSAREVRVLVYSHTYSGKVPGLG